MNFNTIRTRYTAMLSSIALVFVIAVVFNLSLVSRSQEGMEMFGQQFNPAISAILNADRDLYQARVAELHVLLPNLTSQDFEQNKADFEENAQQAFDRMKRFQTLMSPYPEIIKQVAGFDNAFNDWKSKSAQVFELARAGDVSSANQLSNTKTATAFNALRDYYDAAGEAADKQSKSLSNETIESVSSQQNALMIFSIIVVLATIAIAVIVPKQLSDALERLVQQLKGINSGDGNLTRRINSKRKDEVGAVANALDEFIDTLAKLIHSIAEQSAEVINGVNALDKGAKDITATSEKQMERVDTAVSAVEEMSYAIKDMSENASLTSKEIDEVNRLSAEGSNITDRTVSEMNQLSNTVANAASVISRLSENSADIASVVDVIRGIAEQTNLLALNAAIEAARAGEQGRGFAVVADEVRTLASRTQESTQSIQDMIESLQQGVQQAVSSINMGTSATQSTVELAQQTLEALNNISIASSKVKDVAAQTAAATQEQSDVVQSISQNLMQLSEHTKANFDVSQNNGHQAELTMGMATELSESVKRFEIET